jgi:anti-sigma B factor antagonist
MFSAVLSPFFFWRGYGLARSLAAQSGTKWQSGNVKIITFTGDKVRDVENVLAGELLGRTDDLEGCHLLLDFSHVDYLTSVELGTLITLHKRMKASGGRLTLFNMNPQVCEIFAVTRLQTLLGICREESPVSQG